MNIQEAAKRAGTSVRTLRYYEEVGLIAPDRTAENNYREYGEETVNRVRLIRAYRELQFSLEQIRTLMTVSPRERDAFLQEHIEVLEEKRRKIEHRIDLLRSIRMLGPERAAEIDFSTLDEQMDNAKKFLEENEDMKRLSEKFSAQTKEQSERLGEDFLKAFCAIATAPEDEIIPAIHALETFITENAYPCTPKMLDIYARAYGSDGLLGQAVEDAAGPGAAKRLRERITDYLKSTSRGSVGYAD